jgi:hypothetical protein
VRERGPLQQGSNTGVSATTLGADRHSLAVSLSTVVWCSGRLRRRQRDRATERPLRARRRRLWRFGEKLGHARGTCRNNGRQRGRVCDGDRRDHHSDRAPRGQRATRQRGRGRFAWQMARVVVAVAGVAAHRRRRAPSGYLAKRGEGVDMAEERRTDEQQRDGAQGSRRTSHMEILMEGRPSPSQEVRFVGRWDSHCVSVRWPSHEIPHFVRD